MPIRSGIVENDVSVQGEPNHSRERVLRLTGKSLTDFVLQRRRPKADGTNNSPQKQLTAVMLNDDVHHPAVEQAKIRLASRHFHAAQQREHLVKRVRCQLFEFAGVAVRPFRMHHVEPLLPRLDHLGNQLWRVLQVAIHRHDDVALGGAHPRQQRLPVPKLREKLIPRIRGSVAASSEISSYVPSRLPSSTKTASQAYSDRTSHKAA